MGLFGNKRDKSVVKGEKSEYHSSSKGPRSGGVVAPPPSSYDPYGQMLGQQHKFGLYPSMNKSLYGVAPNPFDPQQQASMFVPPQASLQAQANAIFQMQQQQQQQGGGGGGGYPYPGMGYSGQQQMGGVGQGLMAFGGQGAMSSPYFDGNNYFGQVHQQQHQQPASINAFAPYQGLNFSDPSTAAAMGGAFAGPYGYMPAGY